MATRFKPEFTTDDIFGLYRTRVNDRDENRLRSIVNLIRPLCRMEHEVKIPDQYKVTTREVRTPFLRDAWLRIAASLIAKYPLIHVEPLNPRLAGDREAANIAERADSAMIERFNKELSTDIIHNLAAQQVRDGSSVLKVVHRPDAWANFPLGADRATQDSYKLSAPFPIAWRDIDRLSTVFDGGEYGDAWVIEYGEFAKAYLRSRYKMVEIEGRLHDPKHIIEGRSQPEGLMASNTGVVVKIEFFTPQEWHLIIDGTEAPGWPKPNPYAPHIPYFRADNYDSESLLYSLLYLVPRLDELLTMKMNWASLAAYPNPVLESIPNAQTVLGLDEPLGVGESESGDEEPFEWKPGKLIETPPGKKFGFISPPGVGRDLNELSMIFRSLIEVAGIPSIMRGAMMSGETGYLANQQMAAASVSYRVASTSGQRQLEKGIEFSHWLIQEKVRQTVYIIGWESTNPKTKQPTKKSNRVPLGLSPNESGPQVANLSRVGRVEVRYRPVLPTDDQARAMIAIQLTNSSKPLSSRRAAIETWLQEEDPDGIMEEMRVEDAMDKEPLASFLLDKAMKRAGLIPEQPNPADQLVGPDGRPLIPPGPTELNPITPAQESVLGTPAVQGQNMPIIGQGGRPAGAYPGQPGGPRG